MKPLKPDGGGGGGIMIRVSFSVPVWIEVLVLAAAFDVPTGY
jgi:hypothetical protein